MSELIFTLNGQPIPAPISWEELNYRTYFSKELNGYLDEFDGEVGFIGDQYNFLRDLLFSDTCAVVDFSVIDGREFRGKLFLNDATWNLDDRVVMCQIITDSYLSVLDNNKSIQANLGVPKSKNGTDISAWVNVQTDLTYTPHNVAINTATPANRKGVRVYDAFAFLMRFMSDGAIGFASDFFFPDDSIATMRPRIPTLVTGKSIRTNVDQTIPQISFEELYTDLQKLYNLAFAIEGQAGSYVLRIEPVNYFKGANLSYSFINVSGMVQSSDSASFYDRVILGNDLGEGEFNFYPKRALYSWTKEEYHLGGICNNDVTLDLSMQTLLTDTNDVMACLPFGVGNPQSVAAPTSNTDDNVYLVLFDINNYSLNYVSELNPDERYYNGRINNATCINFWYSSIPNNIYLFLGANSNDALAAVNSPLVLTLQPYILMLSAYWFTNNMTEWLYWGWYSWAQFPITTPPLGYDVNGNIVQGTTSGESLTYYQCPVDGIYKVNWQTLADGYVGLYSTVQFRPSEPANTRRINSFEQGSGLSTLNAGVLPYGNFAQGSYTFACLAGDCIGLVLRGAFGDLFSNQVIPTLRFGSTFEVRYIGASSGDIEQTFDISENYLLNTSFDNIGVPSQDFAFLLDNKFGVISASNGREAVKAFISEISRNFATSKTSVKLLGRIKDSSL